jgi:putative flippase GtrA
MILSKAARRNFPFSVTQATEKPLALFTRFPRPLRFLSVGALSLATDIFILTGLVAFGLHPLLARVVSLAVATMVTWRLNRALTFDRSHRHQGEEAARYTMVTITAQTMSYTIFAVLVMTVLSWMPQAALVIGAAFGAVIGYLGHRFFAFAPKFRQLSEAPHS